MNHINSTPSAAEPAARKLTATMRIAIVGGGATGTLAAVHIARRTGGRADIVVIDPAESIGRGLAYSTPDPRHLLNVRVSNMSAFPDDPGHLHEWLRKRGGEPDAGPLSFISRGTYGDYLGDLGSRATASGAVRLVRDFCVDLYEGADTVVLRLQSGATIEADLAILATGNDAKPAVDGFPAEQPWSPESLAGLPPGAPILIIGTGLTMVDMTLSLERRGHSGPVVAVSRRGLAPSAHRACIPRVVPPEEVPFGADLSKLLRWLRGLAVRLTAEGGDWRSAVDGLRPHTQRLWRAMTTEQKRRFLRHARAYWEVHRHRMAPEIEAAIGERIRDGRQRLMAGRVLAVRRAEDGFQVRIARRGSRQVEEAVFARIIDCTGLADDPLRSANPLIRSLIARGAARPDPLGIGLDIGEGFALVGADGAPSARIRAIGPLARAAFWECIAVPDIRLQCKEIAEAIAMSN